MKIRKKSMAMGMAVFIMALSMALGVPQASRASDFTGLGIADDYEESYALATSADGSIVVGRSRDSHNYSEATMWSKASDILILREYGLGSSYAYGISADGTRIVGYTYDSDHNSKIAYLWTESTGMVLLGDFIGGEYNSRAYDISDDGTTVVGYGASNYGTEAFIWTEETGMVSLGDLDGGDNDSKARAVSADGSVVTGWSDSEDGTEAFIWTEETGIVGLGDLDGGKVYSRGLDISADGSAIVGYGKTEEGRQAFLWTEETGMVGLGLLEGTTSSVAKGVSGDGSIVVGSSGDYAFIWTEELGMLNLYDFLVELGIDGLEGWSLDDAEAISNDGLTLCGDGINPDGVDQAWIVHLDEGTFSSVPVPGAFFLLGTGLLTLAGFRRKI